MDIHAQPISMQAQRAFNAGQAIKRVQRRQGMHHTAPARIDGGTAGLAQGHHVGGGDAGAGDVDLGTCHATGHVAGGKAGHNTVHLHAGRAFGLVNGATDRHFGLVEICHGAALQAHAGLLPAADDPRRSVATHQRNQGRYFRGADIKHGDRPFGLAPAKGRKGNTGGHMFLRSFGPARRRGAPFPLRPMFRPPQVPQRSCGPATADRTG